MFAVMLTACDAVQKRQMEGLALPDVQVIRVALLGERLAHRLPELDDLLFRERVMGLRVLLGDESPLRGALEVVEIERKGSWQQILRHCGIPVSRFLYILRLLADMFWEVQESTVFHVSFKFSFEPLPFDLFRYECIIDFEGGIIIIILFAWLLFFLLLLVLES